MTKQEVLEQFCALSTEVMNKVFDYQEPADCFCGLNAQESHFQAFSPLVMEFIKNAVAKELGQRKATK